MHSQRRKEKENRKNIPNLSSYINGWYRGKAAFNARCFAWQHSKITYKIKDKTEHHSQLKHEYRVHMSIQHTYRRTDYRHSTHTRNTCWMTYIWTRPLPNITYVEYALTNEKKTTRLGCTFQCDDTSSSIFISIPNGVLPSSSKTLALIPLYLDIRMSHVHNSCRCLEFEWTTLSTNRHSIVCVC